MRPEQLDLMTSTGTPSLAPDGRHLDIDGAHRVLEVDDVVVCAGLVSQRELYDPLVAVGADVAAELDAKRAIEQATRLAARL